MAKTNFFHLLDSEKRTLLNKAAAATGMRAQVIEKDYWICWSLQQLFAEPVESMVFKGGTSLSKAYQLINRISEDIDLTVDTRKAVTAPQSHATRSAVNTHRNAVENYLGKLLDEQVVPMLQSAALRDFGRDSGVTVKRIDSDEIEVHYPVHNGDGHEYIKERVLLEFGGRMTIEPNTDFTIKTYLADHYEGELPIAKSVPVLSVERTFWEKVTLMHDWCLRPNNKETPDRSSRHWYDITQIMVSDAVFTNALRNRELLKTVVELKELLYRSSHSDYSKCLNKQFLLLPGGGKYNELRNDYRKMSDAGMFIGTAPNFEAIAQQIDALQQLLNAED